MLSCVAASRKPGNQGPNPGFPAGASISRTPRTHSLPSLVRLHQVNPGPKLRGRAARIPGRIRVRALVAPRVPGASRQLGLMSRAPALGLPYGIDRPSSGVCGMTAVMSQPSSWRDAFVSGSLCPGAECQRCHSPPRCSRGRDLSALHRASVEPTLALALGPQSVCAIEQYTFTPSPPAS